jgi:hypothetical protein
VVALADSCSDFPVISRLLCTALIDTFGELSSDIFSTEEPWSFSCGYNRQTVEVRQFINLTIAIPTSSANSAIHQPFDVLDPPYPALSFRRIPFAVLDSVPFYVLILPTTQLSPVFFCQLLST